jgi:sulfatase modifying factor 1
LSSSCCGPSREVNQPVQPIPSDQQNQSQTVQGQCSVSPHPQRLIYLEGGTFLMGTNSSEGFPADGEGPVREVTLLPFWVDPFTVSNQDFSQFVQATGYVTEAERFGWSFVFHLFVSKTAFKRKEVKQVPGLEWWLGVERACWKRPEGRGSDIRKRMDHPVVHVSFQDALEYCRWAGVRLLTEAEWEYAARGGLVQNRYVWGEELTPHGIHRANIWQGEFPRINTKEDGYAGTAPVDSFEPNGFGLYNMAGNVWEWCNDWFSPDWHKEPSNLTRNNPQGPTTGDRRVNRGGSYLCHGSYCNRYRVAARSSNTPDSSTGNLGFRVGRTQ